MTAATSLSFGGGLYIERKYNVCISAHRPSLTLRPSGWCLLAGTYQAAALALCISIMEQALPFSVLINNLQGPLIVNLNLWVQEFAIEAKFMPSNKAAKPLFQFIYGQDFSPMQHRLTQLREACSKDGVQLIFTGKP